MYDHGLNMSDSSLSSSVSQMNYLIYEVPMEKKLAKRMLQGLLDLIGIVIGFLGYSLVLLFAKPAIRFYTCDMSDISFPYMNDIIPFYAVAIYGTLTPLIAIILVELGNARVFPFQNHSFNKQRDRMRQFGITTFHAVSLFLFGMSLTLFITEIGKDWFGQLRPHFLAICQPDIHKISCTVDAMTGSVYVPIFTGDDFCTGSSSNVDEARRSFPSGHASFAFYTMVFLIIYLEARLFLLRARYIKGLLQVTAFIAAFVTAASRVIDYHHRGVDVLGGALLGTGVAIFITVFLGRVLWDYARNVPHYDFDLKPHPYLVISGVMPPILPIV